MNLSTDYLGLRLRTPLVPSPSPLSERLDSIKRMEDAGASAVVLHSLFAEQLVTEQFDLYHHLTQGIDSYAESLSYAPNVDIAVTGPETYLSEIQAAKAAVDIPIIASLNGARLGDWTSYAQEIQQAGADALELNIYWIPTDQDLPGSEVEARYLEIVRSVTAVSNIPVAVKLSPFFSSLANMAREIVRAGAKGLVLFNRFYQPDINLRDLSVEPNLLLSTPMAMRLPLRWIAILRGRLNASFAATSGIHRGVDAAKLLLVGADVTMLCSVLLRKGIHYLTQIENELRQWMEENEYESVDQLKGSLSQISSSNPEAFERVQYVRAVVGSWRGSEP